jgi:Methyltransferase domain
MICTTDKVTLGYLPTYQRLAHEIGPTGRVCEVGVYRGGSLELWQQLFPRGVVVGVDHDPNARWPNGTIQVVAAQDAEGLPAALAEHAPQGYDLIVDDASHQGALTRRTFQLLWPLVRPGRWYVIEDWQIGFGDWADYDASMLDMARDLLLLLGQQGGTIEEIVYRYGMILLRKAERG